MSLKRPLLVALALMIGHPSLAKDASRTSCGAFLSMNAELPSYGELLRELQKKLAASPIGRDTFLSQCAVEGYISHVCGETEGLTLGQAVERLKALHAKQSRPTPRRCGA